MSTFENSYLNQDPQENRADDQRPMKDSPIPKLSHSRCEPSTSKEDPISPIEEEPESIANSKLTTPSKAPSTRSPLISSQIKDPNLQTPSSTAFKMKHSSLFEPSDQDICFKSATRVKVNENGEHEIDVTWTEFKKKLKESFSGKISTPTQTSAKELRALTQSKSPLRKSARLANIKSQTCEKRKNFNDSAKGSKKIKR